MNSSVLILAAGEGTRMKSQKPKVVHEIMKKPLIRWVVDAARQAHVDDIVTVLGYGRKLVEPLVNDTHIVIQEEQLGTAHAVMMARDYWRNPSGSLVVLTGDSPLITPETIEALIATRESSNAAVVVLTMLVEDPTGYGRILRDKSGKVCQIVEHKDCTSEQLSIAECNSGFYCFDAEYLFKALDQVSTDNAQNEYYLTDVVKLAYDSGEVVEAFLARDPDECHGVNSRAQLAQATEKLQRRINARLMESGVTIMDPKTAWIGPDVLIGVDTTIYPNCLLLGKTTIGKECEIGPNTHLENVSIGDECRVDETIAYEAQIDNRVSCGPRAYLRPGAHLCDDSKAGTHVEIKKSTIGKGSKVPHLSYIGDATLGEGVNIGAGTITCNYDGEKKWPTVIGDHAFVGSDVMLVAPVSLGDNCLIGAGSVITKDVSAGALGLGRARQTEIEHWNEK